VLWDLSPNNRLTLTALASSGSSLYGGAAFDRAAAWGWASEPQKKEELQ